MGEDSNPRLFIFIALYLEYVIKIFIPLEKFMRNGHANPYFPKKLQTWKLKTNFSFQIPSGF